MAGPRKYTVVMILSLGATSTPLAAPQLLAAFAVLAYAVAALPLRLSARVSSLALVVGWLTHLLLLVLDISGWGQDLPGTRLGFAPVLSATVWLLLTVHAVESRDRKAHV